MVGSIRGVRQASLALQDDKLLTRVSCSYLLLDDGCRRFVVVRAACSA